MNGEAGKLGELAAPSAGTSGAVPIERQTPSHTRGCSTPVAP